MRCIIIVLNTKTCTKCHKTKSLDEFHKDNRAKDGKFSRCKKCRNEQNKTYYQEHREELKQTHKKYQEEHEDELREKAGHISMYENKLCPAYLGIVIAERLVRHLFNDVEVMPNGNPKFDFICNKGKKIDVKARCIDYTNNGKNPRWKFEIRKNIIADYFILVAFDSRKNLNPLHIWIIPGHILNKNLSKSISLSTVYKWDKYKKDIKDAQICCNEIRGSE